MIFYLVTSLLFTQFHYLNGFAQFLVTTRFAENHRTIMVEAVTDPASQSAAASHSPVQTLKLFSPCKINLFLRILRKRDDGYHDLASLFQTIGFGDSLELSVVEGEKDDFECNMPGVPVDSSNLVIRALQLMREKTGSRTFFRAKLLKQVPAQAGLGGGSANAATAMWGANELMGRPACLKQVSQLLHRLDKL
jgi:hypothetical protein